MNKKLNRDLLDRAISRKQRDEGTELNSVGGNDALNRKDLFYCTVRNIPSHLKSKDLRRHRPECQQESTSTKPGTSKGNSGNENSTSCCMISFTSARINLSLSGIIMVSIG
ncbi:hypothetical protein RB195_012653 [Necator americanus]|uniref:Uncharacterized protein n=1 Tax=Necator americanus TaxID=51031 RepID=A0ABR1DRY8_NECAM